MACLGVEHLDVPDNVGSTVLLEFPQGCMNVWLQAEGGDVNFDPSGTDVEKDKGPRLQNGGQPIEIPGADAKVCKFRTADSGGTVSVLATYWGRAIS